MLYAGHQAVGKTAVIHIYIRYMGYIVNGAHLMRYVSGQHIAQIYWNEKNYAKARHHFIYSKDGHGCAKLLIEFQTNMGYRCEVDLFIAQAVLQYLCLSNKITANQSFTSYTQHHPSIQRSGPPYLFPLLNFIWFLLQAIERYWYHRLAFYNL